jgi:phage virion morphogenesis protein
MAAVVQTVSAHDFEFAADFLNGVVASIDIDKLELGMAATIESQTKRRIAREKTAPDGTPWANWSPEYAKTRHQGHSLLRGEGNLLDDIFSDQTGGGVVVGSSMVYAAIHQFGGEAGRNGNVDIAARPFLGLSDENEAELEEILFDYVQRQIQ